MALNLDFVTSIVSFFFTLLIFSYIVGDNPFFRVALYAFIGISAGYAASVAWHQVLQPKLFQPLLHGSPLERALVLVPLLFGVLLLMKLSPMTTRLGDPGLAFMVGAAAAVAVGGAVLGTLLPQAQATVNLFDPTAGGAVPERIFEGSIILIGTLTTLIYFHFSMKATENKAIRNFPVNIFRMIGQIFIAITFGVLFAGVFAASMTALIERLNFLWGFIASFF